ncbi:unnamed protein product, partial [Ectocarpus fasciculatus]
ERAAVCYKNTPATATEQRVSSLWRPGNRALLFTAGHPAAATASLRRRKSTGSVDEPLQGDPSVACRAAERVCRQRGLRFAGGRVVEWRLGAARFASADRLVLKQGSVDLVRIQVPWKSFGSMKASLQVSGLTLVLEPLGSANYDDEIERGLRDAIFAKKQELLANAEAQLAGVRAKAGWGARFGSFLASSFMARIVRKLSVTVENVHVVWLQAEHAQTSPVQSPHSPETCPAPSP